MRTPFAIKLEGQDLRNFEFPSTGVTFSESFLEIGVAHHWGLTPMQFGERPKEDRLLMISHYIASQKIDEWLVDKSKEEADAKNRQNRHR